MVPLCWYLCNNNDDETMAKTLLSNSKAARGNSNSKVKEKKVKSGQWIIIPWI